MDEIRGTILKSYYIYIIKGEKKAFNIFNKKNK